MKNIIQNITVTLSALYLITLSYGAIAHERFIVPSHTLLSGDTSQYVTLTASISNDIFHPDRPLGDSGKGVDVGSLKQLFDILRTETASPTGKIENNVEWLAFQRLSVADIQLKSSGTYRISIIQPDVSMTTYTTAKGDYGRKFGINPELPADISNIVRRTTSSSVETYISLNEPNTKALTIKAKGLSLGGSTHPNDLFAGEEVNFSLFFNGKPLEQKAKAKLIKAGTRHRNDRGEKTLVINKNGEVRFTPETAGFYYFIVETENQISQPADVDVKHHSLYATLEVFPE